MSVLAFEYINAIDSSSYISEIDSTSNTKENANMSSNALELIKASVDEARKGGRNVTYIDRILARAGVKLEVGPDETICLAELDRKMSAADMNINERVQVKSTLFGLGLLAR
jgi:hypothetical protein